MGDVLKQMWLIIAKLLVDIARQMIHLHCYLFPSLQLETIFFVLFFVLSPLQCIGKLMNFCNKKNFIFKLMFANFLSHIQPVSLHIIPILFWPPTQANNKIPWFQKVEFPYFNSCQVSQRLLNRWTSHLDLGCTTGWLERVVSVHYSTCKFGAP